MVAASIITGNQEDYNIDIMGMAGVSRQMSQSHSLLTVFYIFVDILSQGISDRNSLVIDRIKQFVNYEHI